jgi:murein DD-endopeptidase MepM/ murein hydrolase activator NlpD
VAPVAWHGRWRRHGLAAVVVAGLVVVTASARDRMPTAAVANSFAPAAQAAGHAADQDVGVRAAAVSAELRDLLDSAGTELGAELGAEPAPEPGDSIGGIGGELDEELGDEELEDPGVFDNELPPTIEDVLENSGEPLEERLPTLLDWVYPVAGSDESFPLKSTRRFGAPRDGVKRTECGRGHCGVDLDGPRGTPVVAVAWGEITRIERRSGRSSGKYVRIEHPDYVYTSYMHLDSIADGLEVGDEVQPGDVLGTLGRTGIRNSAAHLHLSLEIPRGDHFEHLDPTPYLRKAARIDEPSNGPVDSELDDE